MDKERCTGCRICLEECPFDVPAFGADDIMQKCDMCIDLIDVIKENPPCVETCPTKALVFCKMDKQEKMNMEESMKKLISVN